MHDPWTRTMVRGLPEGVEGAGWSGDKGGKIRTTIITQSIKYNFKKYKNE